MEVRVAFDKMLRDLQLQVCLTNGNFRAFFALQVGVCCVRWRCPRDGDYYSDALHEAPRTDLSSCLCTTSAAKNDQAVYCYVDMMDVFLPTTHSTTALPRGESVGLRDQAIFLLYTPCVLVSRIASVLPHCVDSVQTNQGEQARSCYSRPLAVEGRNQILGRKLPNESGRNRGRIIPSASVGSF